MSSHHEQFNTGDEGNGYYNLLQTVSSFQSDQERSGIQITQLTKKNLELNQDRESLRSELVELRLRFDESKQCITQQIESSSRRERELSKVESRWRASVEKERKEISNLYRGLEEKECLLNRKYVEGENSGSIDGNEKETSEDIRMELQIERARYLELRREYELFKVKQDASSSSTSCNVESANKERESLSKALSSYTKTAEEKEALDYREIRSLKLQLKESNALACQGNYALEELRTELEQACKKKTQADVAKFNMASQYEVKMKQMHANISVFEAKRCSLEKDVKRLQNDIKQANKATDKALGRVHDIEKCLSTCKMDSDRKLLKFSQLEEELKREIDSWSNRLGQETTILKEQNSYISSRRISLESDLKRVVEELQKYKKESIITDERKSAEFQSKINEVLLQNARLEKANSSLRNDIAVNHTESISSLKNLERAIEISQHNINLLTDENRIFRIENDTISKLKEELQREQTQAQEDLQKSIDANFQKQRDVEECERDLSDVEGQNTLLISQLNATKQDLEEVTTNYQKEMKVRKELQEQMNQNGKEFKLQIQREQKRSNAYKGKALESHARALQAKHIFISSSKK
mmetsp:Transcript_19529/g.29567  ORF Transcript_19529/g.29567 Transcript_19529/m.29567 type:complete len:589 (+) Transcript_19529:1933-3699(+)